MQDLLSPTPTRKPLRKALKSNQFEAFWSSAASGAFLGCFRHPLLSGPERKHCSREQYNLAKPIVKPIEIK